MTNDLFQQMERLQNLLVARATGTYPDEAEYLRLRQVALSNPIVKDLAPEFLKTSRDLFRFWEFIKHEFGTYADRRRFLWDAFQPMLDHLESIGGIPIDEAVEASLHELSSTYVQTIWSKALERRETDPEGAITLARTLLETVCKHILDETGEKYESGWDLPRLYKVTSRGLGLSPSQHTEQVFKQILSGCVSVVEGLGSLRNKLSDSHGKGRKGVKPASRHAELAVNLAGSMAAYLVATWQNRQESQT